MKNILTVKEILVVSSNFFIENKKEQVPKNDLARYGAHFNRH